MTSAADIAQSVDGSGPGARRVTKRMTSAADLAQSADGSGPGAQSITERMRSAANLAQSVDRTMHETSQRGSCLYKHHHF
jgi:hypothetical protein